MRRSIPYGGEDRLTVSVVECGDEKVAAEMGSHRRFWELLFGSLLGLDNVRQVSCFDSILTVSTGL